MFVKYIFIVSYKYSLSIVYVKDLQLGLVTVIF